MKDVYIVERTDHCKFWFVFKALFVLCLIAVVWGAQGIDGGRRLLRVLPRALKIDNKASFELQVRNKANLDVEDPIPRYT